MKSAITSGTRAIGNVANLLLPFATILSISLTACAGGKMKGSYSKDSVQPVTVRKQDNGQAVISFAVPLESMYYVAGLSYKVEGDNLVVAIDRCAVNSNCKTMAAVERPLGEGRTAEVRVPFNGERITMLHSNGEQQIYP